MYGPAEHYERHNRQWSALPETVVVYAIEVVRKFYTHQVVSRFTETAAALHYPWGRPSQDSMIDHLVFVAVDDQGELAVKAQAKEGLHISGGPVIQREVG